MLSEKIIITIITLSFFTFGYAQKGYIISLAGTGNGGPGTSGYNGDEIPAIAAKLYNPTSVLVDDTGNVYIADTYNYRIRKIDTNGIIHTIAGCISGGACPVVTNGVYATQVGLVPWIIALDKKGNLYITDSGEQFIYKVTPSGKIYIVAGTGTAGYSGDEGPATQAQINDPSGMGIDKNGNIYFSDGLNYVIRKIDTLGIIHTIAGTSTRGYSGDNGPALNAAIGSIPSLAIDTADNIYLADLNGNIRVINPQGAIKTYMGRSYTLDSPDTIARDSCGLWAPMGLSLDSLSQLYYIDQTTARVRQVRNNDTVYTVAGLHVPGYNGDNIPALQAQIGHAGGTAFDKQGNLYIADTDNNRIRKITYYTGTTGIKQVARNNMQVRVYPNPVQNSLRVTINNQQIKEIKIYDVLGKEVRCEIVDMRGDIVSINVSNLNNGVYFIHVKTEGGTTVKKIIKE